MTPSRTYSPFSKGALLAVQVTALSLPKLKEVLLCVELWDISENPTDKNLY